MLSQWSLILRAEKIARLRQARWIGMWRISTGRDTKSLSIFVCVLSGFFGSIIMPVVVSDAVVAPCPLGHPDGNSRHRRRTRCIQKPGHLENACRAKTVAFFEAPGSFCLPGAPGEPGQTTLKRSRHHSNHRHAGAFKEPQLPYGFPVGAIPKMSVHPPEHHRVHN